MGLSVDLQFFFSGPGNLKIIGYLFGQRLLPYLPKPTIEIPPGITVAILDTRLAGVMVVPCFCVLSFLRNRKILPGSVRGAAAHKGLY